MAAPLGPPPSVATTWILPSGVTRESVRRSISTRMIEPSGMATGPSGNRRPEVISLNVGAVVVIVSLPVRGAKQNGKPSGESSVAPPARSGPRSCHGLEPPVNNEGGAGVVLRAVTRGAVLVGAHLPPLHEPVGIARVRKAVLTIETVGVPCEQRPQPEALELGVGRDAGHEPLADAPRPMTRQHEHVGDVRVGRAIADHAGKPDLPALVERAEADRVP